MKFISAAKPFAHLARLDRWQRGETPGPVTVEVDLTNVCSRGCQSCHFAHTHLAGPWASKRPDKPTDYDDTGRFADLDVLTRSFGEMAAAGVQAVVFSGGGEPTLHPQFDAIITAAHDAGLQIGMYTVGGHISKERSALIARTMTWVVISLDAADADTYAAEKRVPPQMFIDACNGASLLAQRGGVVVGVSFLLHDKNWQQAPEMLALARGLSASYVTFRPTIDTDHVDLSLLVGSRDWVTEAMPLLTALEAQEDVEVSTERFLEFRDWAGRSYSACFGIRLVTQVTPDGRVWVCPNRRGIAGSELGDLRTESFASIWARHPGQWTDFTGCRAMCRLHQVNETLAPVFRAQSHEAFV